MYTDEMAREMSGSTILKTGLVTRSDTSSVAAVPVSGGMALRLLDTVAEKAISPPAVDAWGTTMEKFSHT